MGHVIHFRTASSFRMWRETVSRKGHSVGFIPTMGALHEGHISLIAASVRENDCSVCTIYVNPTQFNDLNDLKKYPRTVEEDLALLSGSGVAAVWMPETKEIYPEGLDHLADYQLGPLENTLEGSSRPGHFLGVANVVNRFLTVINPDCLYLGQKDFQQVRVIERMMKVTGQQVRVRMCPIIREADGLAMSSRNVRLSADQRHHAAGISKVLFDIRDHKIAGSLSTVKEEAIRRIQLIPETSVDYLEFCHAGNLSILTEFIPSLETVCVTAVILGGVRLLDNVLLTG